MRTNQDNSGKIEKIKTASAQNAGCERPTTCGFVVRDGSFSVTSCEEKLGKPVLGRLVEPRAGHDKGRPALVVGVVDEENLLIADGKLRTIEKPKKKKIRHLYITEIVSLSVHDKLVNGERIENAELRKFIAAASADAEKQV